MPLTDERDQLLQKLQSLDMQREEVRQQVEIINEALGKLAAIRSAPRTEITVSRTPEHPGKMVRTKPGTLGHYKKITMGHPAVSRFLAVAGSLKGAATTLGKPPS